MPTSRLVVVAVLILAGVVAATSHTSVWSPPREGVGYVSELLTIVVLSFAASCAIAGAFVLWGRRIRRATSQGVLPATVVLAVLISLLGISNAGLHLEAPIPGVEQSRPDGGRLGTRLRMDWGGSAVRNAEEPPSPGGLLPASPGRVLFVRMLLLFVGAAGLALVIRLWRPASGTGALLALDPAETRIRVAAHGAIITTIDAMLADPDARTAIIGAYARLLEELEGIGAHRRAYEGPTEHLRRVLSMLEVGPRPLRTLVRLFEVARFSEQSLTAVHREEALAALREAATFLTTPAGAHSTSGVVE